MTLKLNLFYKKKKDNERIDGRTGDASRPDTQA